MSTENSKPTLSPADEKVIIGTESSFLRMEALKQVDPLDSQTYSSNKYRIFSTQILVFTTSCFLAAVVKQMKLVKPWKEPHRYYLAFGIVPTLYVAINGTFKSDLLLRELDLKYNDAYRNYLVNKA